MLTQPLTYAYAMKFLTWYGCSSREESTESDLQPLLVWWSAKTRDLGMRAQGVVGKGWITVPPKATQVWYLLGICHDISLCLH